MKKLLIFLVAVIFLGCELPYSPIRTKTHYAEMEYQSPGQGTNEGGQYVPQNLAPIDESIVYLWDDINKVVYYASELPDGEGDFVPHPFLYEDGTIARVVAFEYYRPDRHFYLKLREYQPVEEEGLVVGYNEVYRIFRQKNGVMKEAPANTVFPAFTPVHIETYEWEYGRAGRNGHNYPTLFPTDEYGSRMAFCSREFKYFQYFHKSGETEWVIGEMEHDDRPRAYTISKINMMTDGWTEYSKAVFKP